MFDRAFLTVTVGMMALATLASAPEASASAPADGGRQHWAEGLGEPRAYDSAVGVGVRDAGGTSVPGACIRVTWKAFDGWAATKTVCDGDSNDFFLHPGIVGAAWYDVPTYEGAETEWRLSCVKPPADYAWKDVPAACGSSGVIEFFDPDLPGSLDCSEEFVWKPVIVSS